MGTALFVIVAVLLILMTISLVANDAYPHSMTEPIRVDTQTYFMKPGDTITGDMRICGLFPSQLVVNNVTFTGNNSDWAKVDETHFPVTAAPAANGTSSVIIPVTIAVPANYTGSHTLVQAVVETEIEPTGIVLPLEGTLRIIMSNSTTQVASLPECKSLTEIRASVTYSAIILGSAGAGLGAAGYFVYRRSKLKSPQHRASLGAKVLLILLAIIGFFLILGAFLFSRFLF